MKRRDSPLVKHTESPTAVLEPRRFSGVGLVGSHDEIGVHAGDLALETSALVLRSVEAKRLVVWKPTANFLEKARNGEWLELGSLAGEKSGAAYSHPSAEDRERADEKMRALDAVRLVEVSDKRESLKSFSESHPVRYLSATTRRGSTERNSLVGEDAVLAILKVPGEERESGNLVVLHLTSLYRLGLREPLVRDCLAVNGVLGEALEEGSNVVLLGEDSKVLASMSAAVVIL